MKLSPNQAPLYGECVLTVQLGEEECVEDEEDVEFYLLFSGSTQRHLTTTLRLGHVTLQAVCPAHDRDETVRVTLCQARPGGSVDALAEDGFQFVQDLAVDMAHLLVSAAAHIDGLEGALLLADTHTHTPAEECERLDQTLMLALKHLPLPPGWSVLGPDLNTHSPTDFSPHETLLHFAARRGLRRVALFLLQQPGGRDALQLANKHGHTPARVAQTRGHTQLQHLLSELEKAPHLESRAVRRCSSAGRVFQHHPKLNTFSLTLEQETDRDPADLQRDVDELRRYASSHTHTHRKAGPLTQLRSVPLILSRDFACESQPIAATLSKDAFLLVPPACQHQEVVEESGKVSEPLNVGVLSEEGDVPASELSSDPGDGTVGLEVEGVCVERVCVEQRKNSAAVNAISCADQQQEEVDSELWVIGEAPRSNAASETKTHNKIQSGNLQEGTMGQTQGLLPEKEERNKARRDLPEEREGERNSEQETFWSNEKTQLLHGQKEDENCSWFYRHINVTASENVEELQIQETGNASAGIHESASFTARDPDVGGDSDSLSFRPNMAPGPVHNVHLEPSPGVQQLLDVSTGDQIDAPPETPSDSSKQTSSESGKDPPPSIDATDAQDRLLPDVSLTAEENSGKKIIDQILLPEIKEGSSLGADSDVQPVVSSETSKEASQILSKNHCGGGEPSQEHSESQIMDATHQDSKRSQGPLLVPDPMSAAPSGILVSGSSSEEAENDFQSKLEKELQTFQTPPESPCEFFSVDGFSNMTSLELGCLAGSQDTMEKGLRVETEVLETSPVTVLCGSFSKLTITGSPLDSQLPSTTSETIERTADDLETSKTLSSELEENNEAVMKLEPELVKMCERSETSAEPSSDPVPEEHLRGTAAVTHNDQPPESKDVQEEWIKMKMPTQLGENSEIPSLPCESLSLTTSVLKNITDPHTELMTMKEDDKTSEDTQPELMTSAVTTLETSPNPNLEVSDFKENILEHPEVITPAESDTGTSLDLHHDLNTSSETSPDPLPEVKIFEKSGQDQQLKVMISEESNTGTILGPDLDIASSKEMIRDMSLNLLLEVSSSEEVHQHEKSRNDSLDLKHELEINKGTREFHHDLITPSEEMIRESCCSPLPEGNVLNQQPEVLNSEERIRGTSFGLTLYLPVSLKETVRPCSKEKILDQQHEATACENSIKGTSQDPLILTTFQNPLHEVTSGETSPDQHPEITTFEESIRYSPDHTQLGETTSEENLRTSLEPPPEVMDEAPVGHETVILDPLEFCSDSCLALENVSTSDLHKIPEQIVDLNVGSVLDMDGSSPVEVDSGSSWNLPSSDSMVVHKSGNLEEEKSPMEAEHGEEPTEECGEEPTEERGEEPTEKRGEKREEEPTSQNLPSSDSVAVHKSGNLEEEKSPMEAERGEEPTEEGGEEPTEKCGEKCEEEPTSQNLPSSDSVAVHKSGNLEEEKSPMEAEREEEPTRERGEEPTRERGEERGEEPTEERGAEPTEDRGAEPTEEHAADEQQTEREKMKHSHQIHREEDEVLYSLDSEDLEEKCSKENTETDVAVASVCRSVSASSLPGYESVSDGDSLLGPDTADDTIFRQSEDTLTLTSGISMTGSVSTDDSSITHAVGETEEEEKKDRLMEVLERSTVLRSTGHSHSPSRRHSWEPNKNQSGETDMGERSVVHVEEEEKAAGHRRSMSWCPSHVLRSETEERNSRSYSLEGLADEVNMRHSTHSSVTEREERGSLASLTEEEPENNAGENSSVDSQKLVQDTGCGFVPPPHTLTKSVSMSAISPRDLNDLPCAAGSMENSISEEDPAPLRSDSEVRVTKVSRTFSYLKSKMTKKSKDKDSKEKKSSNGHLFSPSLTSPPSTCLQCNRPISMKDALTCTNCSVHVHKGCRDAVPVCAKVKMKQQTVTDSGPPAGTFTRGKAASARERPWSTFLLPEDQTPLPVPPPRKNTTIMPFNSGSLSKSISISNIAGQSDEAPLKALKILSQSSDSLNKTGKVNESTESLTDEGAELMDSHLMVEFEVEVKELEADSWSFTMDKKYLKQLKKDVIKRQDVIYELLQTELHHVRTLRIMAEVYSKGLQVEVQVEMQTLEKMFPVLEELLELHTDFLTHLLERRREERQEQGGGEGGFIIRRIGDVLLHQVTGSNAEKMKKVYGKFCSRHNEAVNIYKELHTRDKRFQAFIKKKMSSAVVRRLSIPECILLVTQRITKYPVLLQRLLQHTREPQEEQQLAEALRQVKEVLVGVDWRVNEYEKRRRLKEVHSRTDTKSIMRLKSGQMFAREDLIRGRKLLHDGPLQLKNAAGRLKDVQALLLSDVFVFLQEKDQKYIFASLDQRSTVISLQKLIVREVANEERGLFFITAGIEKPEMVEVHASSKDERNTWMQLIQNATTSIDKDDDEGIPSENEEDKRLQESKAKEMRDQLQKKDEQIVTLLEEKARLFRELCDCASPDEASLRNRMLFRATGNDVTKGEPIIRDALREVETLQELVNSSVVGQQVCVEPENSSVCAASVSLPRRAETFGGFDCHQMNISKNGDREEADDLRRTESDSVLKKGGTANLLLLHKRNSEQYLLSVTRLHDLLNTLQAVVVQQDTFIEEQRQALSSPSLRHPSISSSSSVSSSSSCLSRPSSLMEQEKQRQEEKIREEERRRREEDDRKRRVEEEERRRREEELVLREERLMVMEEETQRRRDTLQQEEQELSKKNEELQRELLKLREQQRRLETQQHNTQPDSEDQRPRSSSTASEDSLRFLSFPDVAEGVEVFSRSDSKRKAKNLNPFCQKSGAAETHGQIPNRLLQLAKARDKKEKKKKKGKGGQQTTDPGGAAASESSGDKDVFFC